MFIFFSPCDKRRAKSRYLPAGATVTTTTTTLTEFSHENLLALQFQVPSTQWPFCFCFCFCFCVCVCASVGATRIRFLIACHQPINWWTVDCRGLWFFTFGGGCQSVWQIKDRKSARLLLFSRSERMCSMRDSRPLTPCSGAWRLLRVSCNTPSFFGSCCCCGACATRCGSRVNQIYFSHN